MFWTIVAALLFVVYGIPIILEIIKSLFFSLVDKKTDKKSTAKEQLSDIEILYNKQQENIKRGLTFDGKKIEEKQFPCPFCKKLIVDRSKKCNFCGQKLKPLTEKKQKKVYLLEKFLQNYLIGLG